MPVFRLTGVPTVVFICSSISVVLFDRLKLHDSGSVRRLNEDSIQMNDCG